MFNSLFKEDEIKMLGFFYFEEYVAISQKQKNCRKYWKRNIKRKKKKEQMQSTVQKKKKSKREKEIGVKSQLTQ